jgi:hypothetical protein
VNLGHYIALHAEGADSFQSEPSSADWFEVYVGLRPASNAHPPSLRNPQKVKVPLSTDGWHQHDSKKARAHAKRDLLETLKRGQRQIGIPQGGITAPIPSFPSLDHWT